MSKLFDKEFEKKMIDLWEADPVKGCSLIASLLLKAMKQMNSGQLVISASDKKNGEEFYKWGLFFSNEHDVIVKVNEIFNEGE